MGKKRRKSRMGRPPKPPGKKQSGRVVVNMTPAEKARLEKEAKAVGMSLSAYLLECWRRKGEG